MTNITPENLNYRSQVIEHEFRERVYELHGYCAHKRAEYGHTIRLIAAIVATIFTYSVGGLYLHALINLPISFIAFIVTVAFVNSYISETNFRLPGDPYHDAIQDLDRLRPEFTYDFARFAARKGLLAPETILAAHQLFKTHKIG